MKPQKISIAAILARAFVGSVVNVNRRAVTMRPRTRGIRRSTAPQALLLFVVTLAPTFG